MGAVAGTAVGGPAGDTVGFWTGTGVAAAACAGSVYKWANADFESLLSKNRQGSENDDSGSGSEKPTRYCTWNEAANGDTDDCLTGDEDDDGDSVCDSESAPTNPYSLPGGPSQATPEQWANYHAWFNCPSGDQ